MPDDHSCLVVRPRSDSHHLAVAALLVPALAVVVVCLGAQLPLSGSPIVLPIIALIVAGERKNSDASRITAGLRDLG